MTRTPHINNISQGINEKLYAQPIFFAFSKVHKQHICKLHTSDTRSIAMVKFLSTASYSNFRITNSPRGIRYGFGTSTFCGCQLISPGSRPNTIIPQCKVVFALTSITLHTHSHQKTNGRVCRN